MSRRKQAKPRSLKPEEEEWNDEASAAGRCRKRKYSERGEEGGDDDGEANDLQGESVSNEENDADENEGCNADETFEDNNVADDEDAEPDQTKTELYETEDVADVADIKSESMDSFESGKCEIIHIT